MSVCANKAATGWGGGGLDFGKHAVVNLEHFNMKVEGPRPLLLQTNCEARFPIVACLDNACYRVSHNIVSTFVSLNSQPPKHLEGPIQIFFNSPFNVGFKTIQFAIVWGKLD